ncbi:sulfate adenylyltransferase subunit CysD [Candidatus Peregrinibacteria bacterium]|nr:sulfate adenylyltransferase subunit CysD [Candidatus Peregrinibacteria bacterium]
MNKYNLDHLSQLEAESIHIFREAAATFKNPVFLYSVGKDSSVMLKLAEKAFYPGKIPFPLLHIDTGFKFDEMIEFRDYYTNKIGAKLIVHKNTEQRALSLGPEESHTDNYIYLKKTKPLLEAIKMHGFDSAFGGARRDEEKSRAKERIFSVRNETSVWDPKNQRPELWHLYNTRLSEGHTMRVFPLSNWTEADIWMYIQRENIEIVPLYYAKERDVVKRNGVYLRIDRFTQPKKEDQVEKIMCRYRTLGCSPSTGAIPSNAVCLDDIISEVLLAKKSERQTRAIDQGSEASMEEKKKEGYF